MQQPVAQLTLDYPRLLEDLKARIRTAQLKAALAVNRELVLLYWEVGRSILESQKREGWGAKVIDRLASDLRQSFPGMAGLSRRNLQCMRSFAEEFPDSQRVQQLVAQIPWGHILQIQQKVKNPAAREFYIRQTIAHGWSRAVLVHQIESRANPRRHVRGVLEERGYPPEKDYKAADAVIAADGGEEVRVVAELLGVLE